MWHKSRRYKKSIFQAGKTWTTIFLLLLDILFWPAAVPAHAEKGWVVFQEDPLSGPRTVYLSKTGVRIESKGDSSIIVSKAPDWKVVTFSEQKKCYFECPANKFVNMLSKPIAVFYGVNLAGLVLKPAGEVTKYGITITNYESALPYDQKFWHQDLKAAGSRRLPRTASASYTDAFKVAPAVSAVLVRLYNIPALKGVPLVFNYKDQDKTFHWFLRTLSVKSIDLTGISFSQPASYKRVANASDVVRAAADNEDILKNLF